MYAPVGVVVVLVLAQFASCFLLAKSFSHASVSPSPPFRKQFSKLLQLWFSVPWWIRQPLQPPGSWHVHAHVSVTSFQPVVVIEVDVKVVSTVIVVKVEVFAVVALVVVGFGYALL